MKRGDNKLRNNTENCCYILKWEKKENWEKWEKVEKWEKLERWEIGENIENWEKEKYNTNQNTEMRETEK